MRSERLRYSDENCSIRRTLEIVGERWTLLVLREAFYGFTRFEDYVRAIGCPRSVLSARLETLVTEGLLERREYREPGQRARHEYHLTDMGRELFPALLAMIRWGDRWLADESGPPVDVVHAGCGQPVSVEMRCAGGHGALEVRDLRAVAGPGLSRVA